MAIDTRFDTCAECAADEDCAVLAGKPLCSGCLRDAANMISMYEDDLKDAQDELAECERTCEELRADVARLVAEAAKPPKAKRKAKVAT